MRAWKKPAAILLIALICGAAALSSNQMSADREPEGLTIQNQRGEPVTMKFAFAVKNYQWDLASCPVAAGQELLYPFPVALPACDALRDLHLADGVLSISDSKGWFCELRLSMCDAGDRVAVRNDRCYWITQRPLPDERP